VGPKKKKTSNAGKKKSLGNVKKDGEGTNRARVDEKLRTDVGKTFFEKNPTSP